jgi:hypothetical protein
MSLFDAAATVQDHLEDGTEMISDVDRRRRERETAAHGSGIPTFKVNSLLCLSPENPLRKVMIKIVFNSWFDKFILLTIMANCVFLAINDPLCSKLTKSQVLAGGCNSDISKNIYLITETADMIFLIIFTVESSLKIIAMGICREKTSYLRNPWNWLDFVVVVVAWLERSGVGENMSALRTFRVLRPLRTLTTIPGMKLIIVSMMQAGAQ